MDIFENYLNDAIYIPKSYFNAGYFARLPKRGHLKHTASLMFTFFELQNRSRQTDAIKEVPFQTLLGDASSTWGIPEKVVKKCLGWLIEHAYVEMHTRGKEFVFTLCKELHYHDWD